MGVTICSVDRCDGGEASPSVPQISPLAGPSYYNYFKHPLILFVFQYIVSTVALEPDS